MLQQTIRNRQPEGLWGVLLVLGVAAAAIGGSMLFTRLQVRLGSIASVLFIAYGCAIAWFLLYWFVMRFICTANADCFRICRA